MRNLFLMALFGGLARLSAHAADDLTAEELQKYVRTGEAKLEKTLAGEAIQGLHFSQDGQQLLVAAKGTKQPILYRLDAKTGAMLEKIDLNSIDLGIDKNETISLPWPHLSSRDLDVIVLEFDTGRKHLVLDLKNKKPLAKIDVTPPQGTSSSGRSYFLSPDGSQFLIKRDDDQKRQLVLYDTKNGKMIAQKMLPLGSPDFWSFQWTNDGNSILAFGSKGQQDEAIYKFEPTSLAEQRIDTGNPLERFVSCSDAPRQVHALVADLNTMRLALKKIDIDSGKTLSTKVVPLKINLDYSIRQLSADGKRALVRTEKDTLELWDLEHGKILKNWLDKNELKDHSLENGRIVTSPFNSLSFQIERLDSEEAIQNNTRTTLETLLNQNKLSEEQLKALAYALPSFFDPKSSLHKFQQPKDQRLAALYQNLKTAKENPNVLKSDAYEAPYANAPYLSALARANPSVLTASQSQNTLQLLLNDQAIETKDLTGIRALIQKSGLSPLSLNNLIAEKPYSIRAAFLKEAGLDPEPKLDVPGFQMLGAAPAIDRAQARSILRNKPATIKLQSDSWRTMLSPDGRYLAKYTTRSNAEEYSVFDMLANQFILVPTRRSSAFGFSQDSKYLISVKELPNGPNDGYGNSQISVTDLASGKTEILPTLSGGTREVRAVFASKNLRYFATTYASGQVFWMDRKTGEKREFRFPYEAANLSISNEGLVALENRHGIIRLWDPNAKTVPKVAATGCSFSKYENEFKIQFDRTGKRLLMLCSDHYRIVDSVSAELIQEVRDESFSVGQFRENHIETFDRQTGEAKIFDLKSGKLISKESLLNIKDEKLSNLNVIGFDLALKKFIYDQDGTETTVFDLRPPSALKREAQGHLKSIARQEKTSPEERSILIDLLDYVQDEPKDPQLKEPVKNLRLWKANPHLIDSKALDASDLPPGYYRRVIEIARKPEARTAKKFNPTPAQAKKVLSLILEDNDRSTSDFDAAAWLLMKSGIELDEALLDAFKIPPQQLRADVEKMLKENAALYLGQPSLAALKLTKAILAYPDSDFECVGSEKSDIKNTELSNTILWFSQYGSYADADRVFFARLARLILEKKKLCSVDRSILLRAMREWRAANPAVQREITCAYFASLATEPGSSRNFGDMLTLGKIVGLQSDLSPSAWIEQMAALAKKRINAPTGSNAGEQDVLDGLLAHALGAPEGKLSVGKGKHISIPKIEPRPGSILKLCRILLKPQTQENHEVYVGGGYWLELMKRSLDRPRVWPSGFSPGDSSTPSASLRDEFLAAGMADDLKAIETSCASVINDPPQPTPPPAKAKPPILAPSKASPNRDFDPRGRRQKKTSVN